MDTRPMDQTMHEGRLSRRAWPIALTAASLATGMGFCFWWEPLLGHGSAWAVPGDIWTTVRSAQYIGWGDLGGIYSGGGHLVTFPGLLLVLAPVVMVTGALGMSQSFPFTLAHPSSWLVIGPVEILVSCVALFAFDALAERLRVDRRRRALLCVAEAVVLWNVSVVWGHPEDALSIGLAVYALTFAVDRRLTAAGWIFGAAVATQPLVLLMAPVLLAMVGRRRCLALAVRSVLPATALLAVPLIAEFQVTAHAIVDQPNYPAVDHVTPWTAVAPRLGGHGADLAVAAGPGRLLAIVLACGIGLWVRRWRDDPAIVVWGCSLALALRCFTESVMVSFYIWPALALCLVSCAVQTGRRLALGGALAVVLTAFADGRFSPWSWWLTVSAGVVVVLWIGVPAGLARLGRPSVPPSEEPPVALPEDTKSLAAAPGGSREASAESPLAASGSVLVGAVR